MSNTVEPARIFHAASLVEYAEGAVVSRMIVKKPAGNVTLFAFDRGEGLAEHSSPHEALVHILDGTAEITIGGQLNVVPNGQYILLPANIPHSLKANERFKMMLTMIRN